jgi:transcriptional regulator with XRE-family HTH domain
VIAAKTPTRRHWELFEIYKTKVAIKMEPEEFLKHWAVNYEELAELCGRSKSTVAHWFSSGSHRREPSEADKRRLAEIHALWSQFENEPAHLREIWARKRDRKRDQKDDT